MDGTTGTRGRHETADAGTDTGTDTEAGTGTGTGAAAGAGLRGSAFVPRQENLELALPPVFTDAAQEREHRKQ
ncbi:hypothetical protein VR46_29445, partial [Streptomyces sp. NRRL S-444]